ncbi:hypothetical protein ACR76B_14470 [Phocaeicola vulgatus]|uniref:hypothetical protein n=1 Tax=Phocaeicola vulgatus TaxID=821 RepID=UPI003DA22C76
MEPVRLEILLDDKTLKGLRSVEGNLGNMSQFAKLVIAQLEQELATLQKRFKQAMAAGTNTDAQMADIQALQGVIRQLKTELQDLEAVKRKTSSTPVAGQQVTASIEDITKKTNNLRLQFQQVARELPSLAMGPQMFILAISNNLPMLTDTIRDVRQQNELLMRSGQKGVPVWKQLAGSLFSWQTALVAAISLGIVYGKDLWEWVKNIGKANKELTAAQKAAEDLNAASKKAVSSKADEISRLRILYSATQDVTRSERERNKAADELQKIYPQYFANLTNEAILAGNAASAYDSLTQALIRAGQAKASEDIIADYTKQDWQLQRAMNADTNWTNRNREEYREAKKRQAEYNKWVRENTTRQGSNLVKWGLGMYYDSTEDGRLIAEFERRTAELEKNAKKRADIQKNIESAAKSVNVTDYITGGGGEKENKDTGKSARDYQDELADARIRAQQKLEAARISVMREGIRKRQALARQELDESLAQIDKEERDTLKKMDEAEKKRGVKSTPEERQAVRDNASQQRLVAYQQYAKEFYTADKEWQEKDLQSWIDYNKEYGTYQQKRLAIMREYTLKSSKEGLNGNDKRMLARQRDEALSELDFNELKNTINWDVIFGNLDKVTKKELQKVKRQIVSFRNSPEFKKNATPEQIQVIEEAIGKIDSEVIEKGGLFGNLTESIREYSEAVDELTAAQRDYDEAVRQYGADSAEAEAARKKRNKAEAGERNAGNNLEASKDKAVRNITAVADAMNTLGEADMSLSSFGSAVGSLVDTLSASGSKIGGIIAAILAILEQIGQKGLEGFVGNILESVMHAAGGLWDSIGRLFGVKGLGGIFKGADYSGYNEMVDQYNRLNEIWDELIDKKKEYIETSYGTEAQKVGEEALALQQTAIDSYRILGRERLNSGASTGSHSIGVRQRKWMSSEDWAAAGAALGEDFYRYGIGEGRMTGLFDLSVEQLEKLKSEAPTFWAKLDDDVRNYLDKIIDGSEKLGDIQIQIKEQLTQISFDNVRDAFYDTLLDMESGAEDFSEDFSGYLQKAILKTSMSKVYDKRLQEWYDKFANYNKEGGIDTGEYKDLQQEWNDIVKDALEERDSLKDIFGWTSSSSSSQSGRAGTVTSMTEETAGRLEGIGNAALDRIINIDNNLTRHLEGMATSLGKIAGNSEYLRHLETINENIAELRRGVKLKT